MNIRTKDISASLNASELSPSDGFIHRHIGPEPADTSAMLETIGASSLDELISQTIPASIRLSAPMPLDEPRSESEALRELRAMALKNRVAKSLIGQGYYDCITPPVILRNILENPGWYTQYTPYQAEIAQGRLEALLNFQTMVSDLTGLPLANASLLDEATAAAEAMAMCHAIAAREGKFFVDQSCHPQTISVVRTRAESMGVELMVGDIAALPQNVFGVLVQYPATDGRIIDHTALAEKLHADSAMLVMGTDLLALTLIKSPGEMGADIAVGSSQRFGVPMGFGGPHAAFMATKTEYARKLPGRIVGVSKDAAGNRALRLAIQTREQHIRREKATSNICTAQVLLAVMASMYAVYHGPDGLRRIARRTHAMAAAIWAGLQRLGHDAGDQPFFDTLRIQPNGLDQSAILRSAEMRGYNFPPYTDGSIGISVDETTTRADVEIILESFAGGATFRLNCDELAAVALSNPVTQIENRSSPYLTHPVFESYHSETEMLRYIHRLQSRDLSLTTSMIALGSCTMKLNATSEMIPVTWPEFAGMHPLAPPNQTLGYAEMFSQLESWLAAITGLPGVSLQPNAGSQGEYAGLLAIRRYHHSRGQAHRSICLIPTSAHGTNPASAVIAGMHVVAVACDEHGNVDLPDLRAKAQQHKETLGCLMLTYPSTHGVFEEPVRDICSIVHEHGGQVYMDGANLNAQVGLTSPGLIGADVCHLNLHKTFCIPHGGGGPGMGPIAVAEHLRPFLPGNPFAVEMQNDECRMMNENEGPVSDSAFCIHHSAFNNGAVSAAPFGSAGILPISWMYIRMMGAAGLKRATQTAILNANYMMAKLEPHYPVLFKGKHGRVAHEFILDCRAFEKSANVKVEDIAKRLMDYGFHAPTMSFPVPGTLMIEPTESESKMELDRFCDALVRIRQEIRDIEEGKQSRDDNPLKNAPHTAPVIAADDWSHPYSRQQAAYPAPWLRDHKFWPFVSRIDNPYGDRNLICTCPPMEEIAR